MFVFTDTVSVLVFVLDFAVKLLQGKLSVGRCTLCLIVSLLQGKLSVGRCTLCLIVSLLQGKLSVGRCTLCLIVSLRTLRPAVRTVVAVCESAAISTVKPLMKDHPDKRPPYEKSAS